MTIRRKLVLVSGLTIALIVGLSMLGKREPERPIDVTFVGFESNYAVAVLEITNRTGLEVVYYCLSAGRGGPGTLSPHEFRKVTFVVAPGSTNLSVDCCD